MTQALVTVAIPFAGKHAEAVNEALARVGNPARGRVAAALARSEFVHFMSITVVGDDPAATSRLVLEASADGSPAGALRRIAAALRHWLRYLLKVAGIALPPNALARYLEAHRLHVGVGWSQTLGVLFAGTPGMSVRRILKEASLAAAIERWLAANPAPTNERAFDTLQRVRAEVFKDVELKECFVADPVPLLGEARALLAAAPRMILSLLHFLLWPIFAVAAIGALASWIALGRAPLAAAWDGFAILGAESVLLPLALCALYLRLRRLEARDLPDEQNPREQDVRRLMELENHAQQNHLTAVSVMKPGLVRRLVLRLVLWAVQVQAVHVAKPGHLVGIGSIHFARWVRLPGTDKLLFYSNYGGSWSSYLEDFIARAAEGLSAIWSNTQGFPRTSGLVSGGASDGERFKRWARRQQIPTRFWYSGYPGLTTARIRLNARIRHGFAGAATEDAAAAWLRLVGFGAAPPETVSAAQVPTLVFGGLKALNYAHCVVVRLSDSKKGREWLGEIKDRLRYGEGRPGKGETALVAGLSASGVRKIAGPRVLDGFPSAFVHGMAAPWRSRLLGDTGVNAPAQWWWGKRCANGETDTDAVLMIYTDDPKQLEDEVLRQLDLLDRHQHVPVHQVALDKLPEKGGVIREPFGFIDGTSQPIMRGTRKWVTQRNSIHVVEPGEMVLGYRDNIGYVAPTPLYNGRDIGRDGTYLVVRQLEQNVGAFDAYLDEVAARIDLGGVHRPDGVRSRAELREWIAAKMVGRWRADGTSLVRHPLPPGHPGRGITVEADNDFLFGTEDPHGARCPFGSHIRRSNPRDTFEADSREQIRITNSHRIFRVGRTYRAQNGSPHPGLLFMCVNADIEGQFEFLQQTWVFGRSFHAMANEADPVVAGEPVEEKALTVPTPRGPLHLPRLQGLYPFVRVRGGGYFFMPGRRALEHMLS